MEIWKDIDGYEGIYQVSSLGRIKSFSMVNKGKIRKPNVDRYGYVHVNLSKDGKVKNPTIHRLVAFAFLKEHAENKFINHKDGNKSNNSIENLEWCSHKENISHAHGLCLYDSIKGENSKVCKYSDDLIIKLKNIAKDNPHKTVKSIADKLGINASYARLVLSGHRRVNL